MVGKKFYARSVRIKRAPVTVEIDAVCETKSIVNVSSSQSSTLLYLSQVFVSDVCEIQDIYGKGELAKEACAPDNQCLSVA